MSVTDDRVLWTDAHPLDGRPAITGSRVVGAVLGEDDLFRATALALFDGDQLWQTSRAPEPTPTTAPFITPAVRAPGHPRLHRGGGEDLVLPGAELRTARGLSRRRIRRHAEEYISAGQRARVKSCDSPLLTSRHHTLEIRAQESTIVDVDRIDLKTS